MIFIIIYTQFNLRLNISNTQTCLFLLPCGRIIHCEWSHDILWLVRAGTSHLYWPAHTLPDSCHGCPPWQVPQNRKQSGGRKGRPIDSLMTVVPGAGGAGKSEMTSVGNATALCVHTEDCLGTHGNVVPI